MDSLLAYLTPPPAHPAALAAASAMLEGVVGMGREAAERWCVN